MENINNETIMQQLHWRYAVKKFDPTKQISEKNWHTLEESLRLAPSSFGLQPWKFLIVQSPEIRKQLTQASYNQAQIETCSHLVVVTHLRSVTEDYIHTYFKQVAKERNVPADQLKPYADLIIGSVKGLDSVQAAQWSAKQAYIAMGVFMTTAALLHVDVCPMEGIESQKYDEILKLKGTPYTSVAILCAGYRSAEDPTQHMKKIRRKKEEVIQFI